MAMPVVVPEKTDRMMTGQDRRLFALFIEHFPFDSVSVDTKQVFINDKTGEQWKFLAKQMETFHKAQADVKSLVINCNVSPSIPSGLKVHAHRKHGKLTWDKAKFSDIKYLFLSEGQKGEKHLAGRLLHKELTGKPVMNACVLDWLLDHPDQIPDSWKGKAIFFWGTEYSDSDGRLCVRYLYWRGTEWISDYGWLKDGWGGRYPALLGK